MDSKGKACLSAVQNQIKMFKMIGLPDTWSMNLEIGPLNTNFGLLFPASITTKNIVSSNTCMHPSKSHEIANNLKLQIYERNVVSNSFIIKNTLF